MPQRTLLVVLLALLPLACADDAPPDAPLEPGTLGHATSQVRVRVVDARGRAPLAGAVVRSDEATEVTDASGEVVLPRGDVVGARASGFVAQSFVGADAGAITIALEPLDPPATRVVSVALDDWSALRSTMGDGLVARVSAGRDARIDRESPSTATCFGTDVDCRVSLTVGEGARHAFAELATIDDGGTPDEPSDDVEIPFGFALGRLVDDDATLARVDEVVEIDVDLRLPEGIDAIVGVPGVRVDDEVLVLAAPTPPRARFVLPVVDGATSWAIATSSAGSLTSRSVERAGAGEVRTAWSPPPPITRLDVAREGEELVFEREGALLVVSSPEHVLRIFDARARIPAAWISGAVTLTATDAPASAEGWDLDEVERRWTRRATRTISPL